MWRTRASAFLLRYSAPGRIPRQILASLKTLNPPLSPLPNPLRRPSPSRVHFGHCRFFSVDPAAGGVPATGEVSSGGDDDPFEEGPAVVSVESGSSLASDENLGFTSQESELWSSTFREQSGKDDIFGGSQDDLAEVNGGGDHSRANLVSEGSSAEEAAGEVLEIDVEKLENALSFLQSIVEEPLESTLDKMDLTLSEEFVVRVLQTPLVLADKLIGFFKWASKKPEFAMTSSVLDLLVRAISGSVECSKNEAYMLWDLIKEIGETEKELLTTEIFNQLISLFSKLEKSKASFEVFNRFEEFGCRPNAESYYLTIQALSKRSAFDRAWSVCERMLASGELPDGEKIGKVIAWLCKGKRVKDAHFVYLTAKQNDKCPLHAYVDFLVCGLSRNDDTVHIALELLDDYSEESRKYAVKPFTSVISGLCRIQDAEVAKKLLDKMIDSGPHPGNVIFNHVISSLSKAGEMDDALALIRQMENRGLRPDIYTYSVIMSGYAKGGLMDEARMVFNEAKKRYPKLISTTYHILIRGYCKIEEFETALECMKEMKNDGIQPNTDEYNKMVQSFCLKALDWRTAEKLLEEMKECGLHLKGITRSLIAAVKELEEEELKNVVAIEA
ncbi:hypothetical protein Taro_028937 [Colocasia esculenta]|uniref:Pentatricopeptide repeat-containing protein n=1 Tax=Colocasia esculenta TaxID=4460 RepID=A0A843VTD5_COLES|nr:hypothetical protein [Colocasia esculenta]